MRLIGIFLLFCSMNGYSQWKSYTIGANGDTLNRVDLSGWKQGPWVIRYGQVRGEPGFEEEGEFYNNRKEGIWRLYSLVGDLIGSENYRWGLKDGICQYLNANGNMRLEQSWKALNPDKIYDTIVVEDLDKFDAYKKVVVKNEGASIKHGVWKYYNGSSGLIQHTERYELGRLIGDPVVQKVEPAEKKATVKPKEVLDFEKKNAGKKKIKVKDGSAF